MSKMKELKLKIARKDTDLSIMALQTYQLAAVGMDYEWENVAVYSTSAKDDSSWYILVVDGVPQSPWLDRRGMVNLLTGSLAPSVDIGEEAARYEQEQSWRENYRKGDWEL